MELGGEERVLIKDSMKRLMYGKEIIESFSFQ